MAGGRDLGGRTVQEPFADPQQHLGQHRVLAGEVPVDRRAGDAHRGASLVVWAIAEGRSAARAVDEFLVGESDLPSPVRPASLPLSVR